MSFFPTHTFNNLCRPFLFSNQSLSLLFFSFCLVLSCLSSAAMICLMCGIGLPFTSLIGNAFLGRKPSILPADWPETSATASSRWRCNAYLQHMHANAAAQQKKSNSPVKVCDDLGSHYFVSVKSCRLRDTKKAVPMPVPCSSSHVHLSPPFARFNLLLPRHP